ncbi:MULTISPECIES: hypothetical protein [unclassified Ruegeria]|nr:MULTISPECIES: hypothetical protein [unclassified Ruegeria]NOD87901.1 hypothetical protein [Ruegeria sp. HKCCD4318]NOE14271.1 hypothetical protein [Ruegeria sp. HKCCD4318-2]NOG08372.1 hypothetical protein [Ruegeria sp. HKCCD4315]
MTNPFRNDQQNPYDLPGGPALNGTRSATDPNMVVYDPVSDAVNPAGVALIQTIMKQVDKRTLSADDVAKAMAKLVNPLIKRINSLEKALAVEISKSADAIDSDVGAFLDEDGPLDEQQLLDMARKHAKMMEGVKR